MIFKDLESQKQIYRAVFESDSGKIVLDDLKNTLCVNSDFLTKSGDANLDNHHREGMRLAFLYIQSLLTK